MSLKEFLNLLYVTARFMTDTFTVLTYGISFILIYVWYKQKVFAERQKFGYDANLKPFKAAITATIEGYFGALVGTFILITLGVVVDENYIYAVIALSLLSSLVFRSYNFLNIIYACGITALFAHSDNDVYSLMVVGISLIFVRGILILISWTKDYIAFIVRNEKYETFGGYSVNKIWPIYAGVIMMVKSTPGVELQTPSWWPLFRLGNMKGMILLVGGAMLFVSNSRNIYTATKKNMVLKSSITYILYGLIFIPLAWLFRRNGLMSIVFVVLAVFVYVILEISLSDNITSKYKIFFSKDKLTVLDVIPSSAAFYAKIKPLDKIISINGVEDANIDSLNRVIKINRHLEIIIDRGGKSISISINIEGSDVQEAGSLPASLYELGIIAVPPNLKKESVSISERV